jgi:hypothetical protein
MAADSGNKFLVPHSNKGWRQLAIYHGYHRVVAESLLILEIV